MATDASPAKPARDRWSDEPVVARAYVSVIVAVGLGLTAAALRFAAFQRPYLFAFVLALSSVAATVKVRLPLTRGASTMSLSYPVNFASLLLLGPLETTLVAIVSGWSQSTFRTAARNPLYRTLFSVASLAVSAQAAGFVVEWMAAGHHDMVYGVMRPVAMAAIVYYTLSTALVAAAVALSQGGSIIDVWHQNFLWSAPHYFLGAATAAIVAKTIDRENVWGVVALIPLYLVFRSYRVYMARLEEEQRQVQKMSDVHLATLQALAIAIEAKDYTDQRQMWRIQLCATALGQAAGLSVDELKGLKTAALLHDIGNLAVPEHILSKPGSLTPEELERLKIHPNVGAAIIEGVPFPYPVAPLIRAHHERWDGSGYPQGLKGEDIPLGARVLAIVDSYTTLMSDRPYRPAYSHDETVRLLRRQSGTSFDPKLVEQFLAILPELRAQLTEDERGAEEEGTNPLKAIAGAHREERILFEIAQALGSTLSLDDTMALVCARLADLTPFTSCGLFLIDGPQSRAFCRYAAGPHLPAIRRIGSRSIEDILATLPLTEPHERVDPAKDLLATKLQLHDQTIGALVIYDTQAKRYTPEHRRVFERVAKQATSVIFNALTFERTQEESVTDPLTGLPNRRHLNEQLDRILMQAGRSRRPVGLLMMDLDGMRQINDGYGHHVGDRALRQVGVALRSFVGSTDLCVRYAGDEFVIVLPHCDADQLHVRTSALQGAVADLWFEVQAGMRLQLAANIGTAVYPQDGLKSDELLETADARMYRQKVARRAQKRVATPSLLATPMPEPIDLPVRAEDAQSAVRR